MHRKVEIKTENVSSSWNFFESFQVQKTFERFAALFHFEKSGTSKNERIHLR